MATYVLVHGGSSGGRVWRPIVQMLREAGHEVYAPSLTGLGDRMRLLTPEVGLDTHVGDIVEVLEYEDLREVILVGYSYGGMVITGVAEQAADRLAHLVYLDAYVPDNGQSLVDLEGPAVRAACEELARTEGHGWLVPAGPTPADLVVPDRLAPLPLKCFQQALSVGNPAFAALPRTFILCTEKSHPLLYGAINRAGARARAAGWRYRELTTDHHALRRVPADVAQLLREVAESP